MASAHAVQALLHQYPEEKERILELLLREQAHQHDLDLQESRRFTDLNNMEIEVARRNKHLESVRVYGTFALVYLSLGATIYLGMIGEGVAAIGSGLAALGPVCSALLGNRKANR